jgi:hypothetical protein
MRGGMRQLVKADQGDLSALPVMDRGFKLQMRELDFAAIWPAPLMHADMWGTTELGTEGHALVP